VETGKIAGETPAPREPASGLELDELHFADKIRSEKCGLEPDHSVFVVPDHHPPAGNNDRAADKIQIPGHHANRFPAGRGFVLHFLLAENFAARVQEILVIVFPDQFLKLRGAQALLDKVPIIQLVSAFLEKPARVTARCASRFLEEIDGLSGSLRSRSGLACWFGHEAFSSIAISLGIFTW
jgi:hypothetical protein